MSAVPLAVRIFSHAEAYHASGRILHGQLPKGQTQFVWIIVACGAFAAELYFKSLATHEIGTTPQGHSLVKLFEVLSPNSKKAIRDLYNKRTATLQAFGDKGDFDTMLNSCKDTFAVMRYFYEPPKHNQNAEWDGRIMLDSVRDAILTIHPSWSQRPGETPIFPIQ